MKIPNHRKVQLRATGGKTVRRLMSKGNGIRPVGFN